MPVAKEDILEVIEGSVLAPGESPDDFLEWFDIEGITGRKKVCDM